MSYKEHLKKIRLSNYENVFFTDNCLPELGLGLEDERGGFKIPNEGTYHFRDITTRLISQPVATAEGILTSPVIPLHIKPPPLFHMFDEPLREPIKSYNNNDGFILGWWKFSQLVKLHPLIERHKQANLLIDSNLNIIGMTYLMENWEMPLWPDADRDDAKYAVKMALYKDACHQYFEDKKSDVWKIEIRKSVLSKLENTNISLPRYMFKDNELLKDGVMFKIQNNRIMVWSEKEIIHLYHFERQVHLQFPWFELPDIINDKEIKRLIKYNKGEKDTDWVLATVKGRHIQDEMEDISSIISRTYTQEEELNKLVSMTIKLLAAYCTPTLKKGIKKISKKAPRLKNRRANMTTPTKWVWGTNKVTYIYPEQRRGKGVDEYYSRPTMAKYYITKLEKYADRPIYEEENENPRYRHSIIRSRAGCWKGGKEKLFVAGGEKSNYSQKAITWLKRITKETGHNIQHAENGKEFRIELGQDNYYLADGFCKETNTVYEFNGDYWHGNPKVYDQDEINKSTKTSFGELYQRTLQKERVLKQMGFNVVSVWESDWVC